MSDKKKYDLAIMNPPYAGNLHLKILEKVIPMAEETINISPAAWLMNYAVLKGWKKSTYQRFVQNIGPKLESYKLINSGNMSDMFDISLGTKGMIGKFKYNANNEIYKEISANNKSKISILNKVSRKVLFKEIQNIVDQYSKHNDYSFWIKMARVHGNSGKWDEYDVLARDIKKSLCIKDKSGEGKEVYFKTENEAVNFFNSVQTIFMKYIKFLGCNNGHDFNSGLPFMNDYTKPWDNKRFCDYFNITGYIDDEHAEPNSEWEEILNTMEKYK